MHLPILKYYKHTMAAIAVALCMGGCKNNRPEPTIKGESFVLADRQPARLFLDSVYGPVSARNTYLETDSTIYYEEGKDFIIDYREGTIARTGQSRIPDYAAHPLYRQDRFGYGNSLDQIDYYNTKFFLYLDYSGRKQRIADNNDQSAFLKKTRAKLQSGEPLHIVWYGNSITSGGEVSDSSLAFTRRYEQYLKEKFPKANIQSENLSIPGYGTPEGVSWFEGKFAGKKPDLVFIGFGMNDQCDEGSAACEPGAFKNNLEWLAHTLKSRFGAEVVFHSAFPPNDHWVHSTHRMEQYAAASKAAAAATGSAYVAVYETWMKFLKKKDQQSLLTNNINHPNDFGHWIYTQAFEAMTF